MHTFPTKLLTLLLAVLLLGTIACEKEPVSEQTLEKLPQPTSTTTQVTTPVVARFAAPNNPDAQQSNAGGLMIDCIVLNFPFELVADSITYVITTVDEFETFLTGPATTGTYINFVYPVSVTLDDGTSVDAADEAALSMLISDCIPDTGWTSHDFPAFFFDDPECLTLAYPVTLLRPDSIQVVVNDAMTLANLLASNPDLFYFQFPLTAFDSDGNSQAIAGAQELLAQLTECANTHTGGGGGTGNPDDLSFILGDGCFTYDYPITLVDLTGDVIIADDNEFVNLLLTGEFVNFTYPFTVTLDTDGSTFAVTNEDTLIGLFNQCGLLPSGLVVSFAYVVNVLEAGGCLQVVYPVTVTNTSTGSQKVINNAQEAQALFASNDDGFVLFPMDIVVNGVTITLTTAEDLQVLAQNCNFSGGSGGGNGGSGVLPAHLLIAGALDPDFNCYSLVFPFSVEEADGTQIVIADNQEAIAYAELNSDGVPVYPVQVVLNETGVTLDLTGPGDILGLLQACL